jgi:hypothetical protein
MNRMEWRFMRPDHPVENQACGLAQYILPRQVYDVWLDVNDCTPNVFAECLGALILPGRKTQPGDCSGSGPGTCRRSGRRLRLETDGPSFWLGHYLV